MSLDPTITQSVTDGLERAYESGRQAGINEAEALYFGKSARVLTGGLFAASLSAASQMLRQHDPEASAFFHAKAAEFQAWVTPPTVRTVEPAGDATGIATGNGVSAQFVSDVQEETISADTFYVYPSQGGSHLAGTVEYDEGTLTVTFTPEHPLSPDTQYTAVLAAAVTAAGGMTLGNDYTWSFTTGDA